MAHELMVLLGKTPWEGPLVAGLAHPASRMTIARRCLDTADLLASAEAGRGEVALVGADAPRLDADVIQRLIDCDVRIVGLVSADDHDSPARLQRWGVESIVVVDVSEIGPAVFAIAEAVRLDDRDRFDLVRDGSATAGEIASIAPGTRALAIAVWGPAGAPGRTSVAIGLADELSRAGRRVLLVDADTWSPSVSLMLGMVDDGAGLASACRRALSGTLDVESLAALTRSPSKNFAVLSGLSRSGRWAEVRSAAMTTVLNVARSWVEAVVIDCGFSLEADEDLVFDTAAPRRNAATFVALEQADEVVVVGAGDPVGLVRLVTGLSDLSDAAAVSHRHVVVTRARNSTLGRRPDAAISELLYRHAGVDSVWCVPDDPIGYDMALREGRTLADVAPKSPARQVVRGLARTIGDDHWPRGVRTLRIAR